MDQPMSSPTLRVSDLQRKELMLILVSLEQVLVEAGSRLLTLLESVNPCLQSWVVLFYRSVKPVNVIVGLVCEEHNQKGFLKRYRTLFVVFLGVFVTFEFAGAGDNVLVGYEEVA